MTEVKIYGIELELMGDVGDEKLVDKRWVVVDGRIVNDGYRV